MSDKVKELQIDLMIKLMRREIRVQKEEIKQLTKTLKRIATAKLMGTRHLPGASSDDLQQIAIRGLSNE